MISFLLAKGGNYIPVQKELSVWIRITCSKLIISPFLTMNSAICAKAVVLTSECQLFLTTDTWKANRLSSFSLTVQAALKSTTNGSIFAGYFIEHITLGGSFIDMRYFNPQIADLISSIIIYACAFVLFIKDILSKIGKKKEVVASADGGTVAPTDSSPGADSKASATSDNGAKGGE